MTQPKSMPSSPLCSDFFELLPAPARFSLAYSALLPPCHLLLHDITTDTDHTISDLSQRTPPRNRSPGASIWHRSRGQILPWPPSPPIIPYANLPPSAVSLLPLHHPINPSPSRQFISPQSFLPPLAGLIWQPALYISPVCSQRIPSSPMDASSNRF